MGRSAKSGPRAAKLDLLVAVKGRERSTIPSIYAQRLFMDHKNNVATGVEELGCTITYRRSERLPRWVEVPNLAHRQPNWICWSLVIGRERSTIPSIYAQR